MPINIDGKDAYGHDAFTNTDGYSAYLWSDEYYRTYPESESQKTGRIYTEAEKTQAVIDEFERLANKFSPDGWFFPVLNAIKGRIIALKQSMKE